MTITATDLERVLQATLQPSSLEVIDDSHLHAGHAGAREGRHFTVRLVGECFAGLTRVARHRLVYGALRQEMSSSIHALAIDARTPTEAAASHTGVTI